MPTAACLCESAAYTALRVSLPFGRNTVQRTFTAVLSRADMRPDAPLAVAIESFFRANYDLAPKTERWYRQNLVAFHAWIGTLKGREPQIGDLDKQHVDAYLRERMATPTRKYPRGSPFVTRAAAVSLKRLASFLAQDGILADKFGGSVLKHVKRTKLDEDVRQPLSDSDLFRILGSAGTPGSRDYTLVILGAGTGLRLNELRECTIGDLDLPDRSVTVRPETSKFGRGRLVHFHDAVGRELDRYLRESRFGADRSDPLFPTRTGAFFERDGFEKIFQRVRERSGVAHFSAHVLRHTWATTFMRAPNANLLELKRQGGWARWEMVERYSHAIPPRDRSALPNPLHKSAFVQLPASAQKRLSSVG